MMDTRLLLTMDNMLKKFEIFKTVQMNYMGKAINVFKLKKGFVRPDYFDTFIKDNHHVGDILGDVSKVPHTYFIMKGNNNDDDTYLECLGVFTVNPNGNASYGGSFKEKIFTDLSDMKEEYKSIPLDCDRDLTVEVSEAYKTEQNARMLLQKSSNLFSNLTPEIQKEDLFEAEQKLNQLIELHAVFSFRKLSCFPNVISSGPIATIANFTLSKLMKEEETHYLLTMIIPIIFQEHGQSIIINRPTSLILDFIKKQSYHDFRYLHFRHESLYFHLFVHKISPIVYTLTNCIERDETIKSIDHSHRGVSDVKKKRKRSKEVYDVQRERDDGELTVQTSKRARKV
jgi:hypothetical protein